MIILHIVNIIKSVVHILFKQWKVYEVLGEINNSMKLEIILGREERQCLPQIDGGVKGHREYIVANVVATIFILLTSTSESPSVNV